MTTGEAARAYEGCAEVTKEGVGKERGKGRDEQEGEESKGGMMGRDK